MTLASDASEAFSALSAFPGIALVVLDLMLPDMHGLEILAVMRADAKWKDIPCIILTAAGQDAQIRTAESLGVAAIMTKPFSPRRLFDRIVTLVGGATSVSQ